MQRTLRQGALPLLLTLLLCWGEWLAGDHLHLGPHDQAETCFTCHFSAGGVALPLAAVPKPPQFLEQFPLVAIVLLPRFARALLPEVRGPPRFQ